MRFPPLERWFGVRSSGKSSLSTTHRRISLLSSPRTTSPQSNHFVSFRVIIGDPTEFFPVQLLGDDPFDVYKVVVEKYITVADKDKQRGTAELIAGVLSGERSFYLITVFMTYVAFQASKHWSVEKQTRIWNWFAPNINKIFKRNIKTDTLPVWTSFLEVRICMNRIRERFLKHFL